MAEQGSMRTNALVLETSDKVLDLTGVSEAQASELKSELARVMIDSRAQQAELNLSLRGLDMRLSSLTDAASKSVSAGIDTTIRNVTEDGPGSTEILLGNTSRAKRGGMFALPATRKMLLTLAVAAAVWLGLRAARAWIVTRGAADSAISAPKARMV